MAENLQFDDRLSALDLGSRVGERGHLDRVRSEVPNIVHCGMMIGRKMSLKRGRSDGSEMFEPDRSRRGVSGRILKIEEQEM